VDKKEYKFPKQKNNRFGILSLFSVLKIYTLSKNIFFLINIFKISFQIKLPGLEVNKKIINKRK